MTLGPGSASLPLRALWGLGVVGNWGCSANFLALKGEGDRHTPALAGPTHLRALCTGWTALARGLRLAPLCHPRASRLGPSKEAHGEAPAPTQQEPHVAKGARTGFCRTVSHDHVFFPFSVKGQCRA